MRVSRAGAGLGTIKSAAFGVLLAERIVKGHTAPDVRGQRARVGDLPADHLLNAASATR